MHAETPAAVAGEIADAERDAQLAFGHQDLEAVVGPRALALREGIRLHPIGPAEQHEHMIDQVRAEVVHHARSGVRQIAPARRGLGSIAIPAHVIAVDLAQAIFRDELAQREEVGIPTPVVEHAQHATALASKLRERARLFGGHGHGFVDDDVLTRLERGARLAVVRLRRRGDDDEIDVVAAEQRIDIGQHIGLRKNRVHLVASAGDDRRDVEPGETQERRVEIAPRQPETDQSSSERHSLYFSSLAARNRAVAAGDHSRHRACHSLPCRMALQRIDM